MNWENKTGPAHKIHGIYQLLAGIRGERGYFVRLGLGETHRSATGDGSQDIFIDTNISNKISHKEKN